MPYLFMFLLIVLLLVGYFVYGYISVYHSWRESLIDINITDNGEVDGLNTSAIDSVRLNLPLHKISTLHTEMLILCIVICFALVLCLFDNSNEKWFRFFCIFSIFFFLLCAYRVSLNVRSLPSVLFDNKGLQIGASETIPWTKIQNINYHVSHTFDNDKTRLQSRLIVTPNTHTSSPIEIDLNDYLSICNLLFPVNKFDHRVFLPLATLCQAHGVKFILTEN